jgi:hypothetical protein
VARLDQREDLPWGGIKKVKEVSFIRKDAVVLFATAVRVAFESFIKEATFYYVTTDG